MKTFKKTARLVAEIKKDLRGAIYPELLGNLSGAVKGFLAAELNNAAAVAGGTPPDLDTTTVVIPPPGTVTVLTRFLVSADGAGETKSVAEASLYKKAFRDVYDKHLGNKPALLRTLAVAGVK